MPLALQLAEQLLAKHPERAARALEAAPLGETTRIVSACSTARAASLIGNLAVNRGAALLEALETPRAAEILELLGPDTAARLLRRFSEEARERLVAAVSPRLARALRALLCYPPNTAGALMDPYVLAIPEDLSAREALARVRESAADSGYNLFVVDRGQRLVGALNLRELFLARPRQSLSDLMTRDPLSLQADVAAEALVRHPGWKRVHSLPVVDAQGGYLGAIRYRVLRALEEELRAEGGRDVDAGRALGELLAAGAAGFLDALATGARGAGGKGSAA